VLAAALSLVLGATFLWASLPKLRHPKGYLLTVLQYDILPDRVARIYAAVVPGLELLVALPLLTGTAALLLFASAGVLARGTPQAARGLLVSGPSPFATCADRRQDDTAYTNAEVEPFLAASPKSSGTDHVNLIGVWQQDRLTRGMAAGLVAASSTDGGKTWREVPLPFSACVAGGAPFNSASDPWGSVGPDGRTYAAAIVSQVNYGAASNLFGVVTAESPDEGTTWTNLEDVGGSNGADKESVTADPSTPRTAYLVWQEETRDSNRAEWFSRTTDGGKTWTPQRIIIPGPHNRAFTVGDQIVIDARTHTLYDVFDWARLKARATVPGQPDVFSFRVAFIRSNNRGSTWTKPHVIAKDESAGPNGGGIIPRGGRYLPAMAIDRRKGILYVVWQDARFSDGRYDSIALSRSSDDGKHWSTPVRVDPGARRAFTPAIAINSRGVIGVTYYTLETKRLKRLQLVHAPHLWTDYWLAVSKNSGHTFQRPTHLAGPFDIKTAPPESGYFLGDYEGLVATGRIFHPFFAAANSGDAGNPTEIFTARVRVP
jgi:hypothetical protein